MNASYYTLNLTQSGSATNIKKFEPELGVNLKYMPQWVNVKIKPTRSKRFEIPIDNERQEAQSGTSNTPDSLVYYKNW